MATVKLPARFTTDDRPVDLDVLAKQQVRELKQCVYLSCNLEVRRTSYQEPPVFKMKKLLPGFENQSNEFEYVDKESGATICFSLQNNGKDYHVMIEKDDLRSDCWTVLLSYSILVKNLKLRRARIYGY